MSAPLSEAPPQNEERRPGTGGALKSTLRNGNGGRNSRSRRPGQAPRPSARALKAGRDLCAPWRSRP